MVKLTVVPVIPLALSDAMKTSVFAIFSALGTELSPSRGREALVRPNRVSTI